MDNPEIDLRAVLQEQAERDKPHDGATDTRLEPWIEEYSASGLTKGGGGGCP